MLASLRHHWKPRLSKASAAAGKLRGSLKPSWYFLPHFRIPLDTQGRGVMVKPSLRVMILISNV